MLVNSDAEAFQCGDDGTGSLTVGRHPDRHTLQRLRQCRLLFQTVVLGGCKVPFSLLLGQQSGYQSAGLVPIHTRDHFTSCHYGVQVFLGALHCRLGFAVLRQRTFQFLERLAVGNLQVYIRKGILQFL